MAFRSQRTPMGAAFPEKPLRLRMGSCHFSGTRERAVHKFSSYRVAERRAPGRVR